MRAFAILLVLTGAFVYLDAGGSRAVWKRLSVNDGFEVLKKQRPVGIWLWGTVQWHLYLARTTTVKWRDYFSVAGMYVDSGGYIVYREGGKDTIFYLNYNPERIVEVLTTPPECLSWIPVSANTSRNDLPLRYVQGSVLDDRPICRMTVGESIAPGFWSVYTNKCHTMLYTTVQEDVEMLVYNELAEVLPQCKV